MLTWTVTFDVVLIQTEQTLGTRGRDGPRNRHPSFFLMHPHDLSQMMMVMTMMMIGHDHLHCLLILSLVVLVILLNVMPTHLIRWRRRASALLPRPETSMANVDA
jgi:hypothetical protein